MNTGENIFNAFKIVRDTYENLKSMIKDCITILEESGKYECLTDENHFIRYKTDTDVEWWFLRHIFLVFKSKDIIQENSLFVIDINLFDNYGYYEEPIIEIAKYEYSDTANVLSEISKSAYDFFYFPLYEAEADFVAIGNTDYSETLFSDEISNKKYYAGIKRVVCTEIPLVEITSNNIKKVVLDNFTEIEKL